MIFCYLFRSIYIYVYICVDISLLYVWFFCQRIHTCHVTIPNVASWDLLLYRYVLSHTFLWPLIIMYHVLYFVVLYHNVSYCILHTFWWNDLWWLFMLVNVCIRYIIFYVRTMHFVQMVLLGINKVDLSWISCVYIIAVVVGFGLCQNLYVFLSALCMCYPAFNLFCV